MTAPEEQISVVVLACGACEATKAALESVCELRGVRLQVVAVNNGGGPEVQAVLERFAAQACGAVREVTVLTNQTNRGACTGRNQALQRADGSYVAMLDNDTICRDVSWLASVVGLLRADPDAGIAGPRIVSDRQPRRLECAGYAISPPGRFVALGAGADTSDRRWLGQRRVQAVGNFVARREVLGAIGGFDPAFDPFGFENVDCCYRVKRLGLKVMCDGMADLHHVGHVTTGGFEDGGRSVLFSKSLLLRRRWRTFFQREHLQYEELMEGVQHAVPE